MTKNEIRGGWELLGDSAIDDFGIFRTRKSKRKNLKNGHAHDFFIMDGLNWAAVIGLTPKNEMVLVRQYRHGSEEYGLEFPGGCIENGEDPAIGAAREFEEETGYRARDLQLLGQVRANPAMMSMTCYYYLARNVTLDGNVHLDPGEDIEVLLRPYDEVYQMLARGEILHVIHVAALGLLALRKDEFLP